MPFSGKLLIEQNIEPFVRPETSFPADESFSSFPGSPESYVRELVEWFEDLEDEKDVIIIDDDTDDDDQSM